MTNREVLEKAIQKAIDGGWKYEHIKIFQDYNDSWCFQVGFPWKQHPDQIMYDNGGYIERLLYDHDFAKALWPKRGEAKMYYTYPMRWGLFKNDELRPTTALLTEWQFHLQQMVIAEDPIKYLGENI